MTDNNDTQSLWTFVALIIFGLAAMTVAALWR